MMYFTSDLHFNHKRIIELCSRPFPDIHTMNEAMIEHWNATVTDYHEPVYVLGDFAFHYKDAPHPIDEIFDRLVGEKHLVVGNHDEQNRRVMRLPWKSITLLEHVRYAESRFILCHFPLERWWHMERGTIQVHGHCHGSLRREAAHRFDVGVDCRDFRPVPATRLIDLAAAQPFRGTDYHVMTPTPEVPLPRREIPREILGG